MRGKPAGDVYLTAARRLGLGPAAAWRSRTPPTGCWPPGPPGCAASPSPTGSWPDDPRYGEAALVLGSLAELDDRGCAPLAGR